MYQASSLLLCVPDVDTHSVQGGAKLEEWIRKQCGFEFDMKENDNHYSYTFAEDMIACLEEVRAQIPCKF